MAIRISLGDQARCDEQQLAQASPKPVAASREPAVGTRRGSPGTHHRLQGGTFDPARSPAALLVHVLLSPPSATTHVRPASSCAD
jgi:hypothetical protein